MHVDDIGLDFGENGRETPASNLIAFAVKFAEGGATDRKSPNRDAVVRVRRDLPARCGNEGLPPEFSLFLRQSFHVDFGPAHGIGMETKRNMQDPHRFSSSTQLWPIP